MWDPHHQVDIHFLERVHKRGTRFVTGNYCMENGNSDQNLKTLGGLHSENEELGKMFPFVIFNFNYFPSIYIHSICW